MARRRPSTLEQFLRVQGVGQKKCDQYGKRFIESIRDYCRTHSLDMDIDSGPTAESGMSYGQTKSAGLSQARLLAFELFKKKQSVKQVAAATKRAESTTIQYLVEFIQKEKIQTPRPWVDDATHRQIVDAAVRTQAERMKDIYDYLEGQVNYDQIRISTACLRNIE